jgi:hypothetical protein|tara:strand:+ start:1932 stop:2123 length:192 start_codon:yes stop_codon:yes gene_type:complete
MDKQDQIKKRLERIEQNHFKHISEDFNEVKIKLEVVRGELKWIKLIGGFIIIESMGILIKLFL